MMEARLFGRLAAAAMLAASVALVGCGAAPESEDAPKVEAEEPEVEQGPTADELDAAARDAYYSYLADQVKDCEQLELGHPLVEGEPWSALAADGQWVRLEGYATVDLDDDGVSELVVCSEGDDASCCAFAYDVDDGSVMRAEDLDAAASGQEPEWAPLTAAQLGVPGPMATDDELLAFAELAKDDMRMAIAGMRLGTFVDGGEGEYAFEEDGFLYYHVPGTRVDDVRDLWYECFSHNYEIDDVIDMPFPYIERDGETYVAYSNMGDEGEEITLEGIDERTDDEVWFTGTATGLISEDVRPIRFSLVLEDGVWKYGTMEWGEAEELIPSVDQIPTDDPATWVGTWKTEGANDDPDVTVTLFSDGTFSLEGDIWGWR